MTSISKGKNELIKNDFTIGVKTKTDYEGDNDKNVISLPNEGRLMGPHTSMIRENGLPLFAPFLIIYKQIKRGYLQTSKCFEN